MTITDKLSLSKKITIVAGIFCVAVSILLLLNYWQFAKNEPLKSKTIEALVQQLKSEPNNDELKQEIRNFDLMVRKAYFNSQWQVKTGAYILLFGAIVFAVGLRFYYSIKSKIEEPEQEVENEWVGRILSQRWIVITGATLMVLALIASFASVDYLKDYSGNQTAAETPDVSSDEGIEVIEVGKPVENISVNDSAKAGAIAEKPAEQATSENSQKVHPTATQPEKEATAKTVSGSATGFITAEQVKANHNGFRGPWGNGVSFFKNIPTSWDGATGANMLWKTTIPKHGYNSPVVWGNRVFLSGADKEAREVYCIDLISGKLLWSKNADNIPGSPATGPKVSEDTGLAAPSVTTDGKKVFAIFANGDVICFDMDGNRLWARNLGLPDNHYGHSSSLITWNGKLFVQYDTNKGGKILALNINTGETVWQTARSSKISWASPVLADVAGKKQLILSSDPTVAGYDTETGKELWKVECMMGEVGPSVTYGDGLVFAGNEYARLVAIDPVTATIKWEEDEYLPEVASPVVANGLLFVATSYGIFACYDAKTGDKLWEEDFGTGFYASPVVADNKVYALDTKGTMHILEISRTAKVIGSPKLGEEGYTTPAFSDGKILIRGKNQLYCFGK